MTARMGVAEGIHQLEQAAACRSQYGQLQPGAVGCRARRFATRYLLSRDIDEAIARHAQIGAETVGGIEHWRQRVSPGGIALGRKPELFGVVQILATP